MPPDPSLLPGPLRPRTAGAEPRRPAAGGAGSGRDRMLDVVRAVAVVRVVAWHTWSWWWLTWLPAMPAMFFANGALLADSLDRRGWWRTTGQRLRRLLPPFWAYALASVATMLVLGWRPGPAELVGWVLPVVDPVGDPTTPGLWIPLWYVRAYLWFVLGAGVLGWLVRRFGTAAIAGAVVATLAAWLAQRSGADIPAEVGDAVTYSVFVMAGMRYRWRGAPGVAPALGLGAAATVAALWWWTRFGPPDGIVNRSLALTMLVGLAGVGVALAAREQLAVVGGPVGRAVDLIGRRALTIYLWQGFGLLAAARLVDARLDPGPLRAGAALVVVAAVIAGAVVVFGPLEDQAAGRRPVRPTRTWRRAPLVVAGAAVVAVALLVPVPGGSGAVAEPPLSGKAVVTRADEIRRQLESPAPVATAPAPPPAAADRPAAVAAVVDAWVARHRAMAEAVDLHSLEGALVAADGEVLRLSWTVGQPTVVTRVDDGEPASEQPLAWWSMTKAATVVWLMRAAEAGALDLDDPLARWVPEAPNAERITLEQLARHSSGIPSELDAGLFEAAPDAAIDTYRDRPRLAFEPGTGFAYSRLGYFLLALAVERATGTTWRSAMEDLAARAGVTLSFDEDLTPFDRVTDPDGHGYRGGLWASGGILSTLRDGARFVRWALTEGVSPGSLARMTEFSSDPDHWFYGIGLMPLCPPCEVAGDRLSASRFGLDAATGFFVVDPAAGTSLMMAPSNWFDDDGPRPEFYELQSELLDAVG